MNCQAREVAATRSLLIVLALLMGAFLLAPRSGVAQEITGGITGTVTDASGAAVPNAHVTATDTLRGTVWPTETNSAGVYNFPRLPTGQYTLKVEAQGFASAAHPAFELQMNQVARVDIQLKVGTMTQTVSVSAAPPLLQTDTMQVGLVTSSNFNVNLPLATRNYIQLTLLTPGVTTTDPSSFENGQRTGGGGRPYVNGNREEGNDFLLNGIDNNQISDNLTSYQPSVDAVQEFNVVTNNAPAQYGQFQGGVVSVTIKSGTDQYHGDAFEFVRNNIFNANNWGRNWNHLPIPPMRWNEFGGTVGGPIRKDKLFFFADYQGERLDNPTSQQVATVMTPAERTGDFSQLLSPGGTTGLTKAIQLYNPCASMSGPCTAPANPAAVRQAFANNQIPITMIDPVAAKLFSSGKYPAPVNSNFINNALYSARSYTDTDQGDAKVDYVVNNKNHLWGSYSQSFQQIPSVNNFPLFGQSFNNSPFHAGVIDWTHTFSPTLVMDAKMGVNRIYLNNGASTAALGTFGTQLGIGDANVHGPGLLALNFSSSTSNLGSSDSEELFADTTLEPTVDFILTHNRHVIHMGFEAMRHDVNTYYAGNNGKFGLLDYSGQYTGGPDPTGEVSPGYADGDFFLGLPNTVGLGVSAGTWGQRSWVYAPYVQDDWRVTQNLTLNLGLRWEYNQPWYEVFNRQGNFGPISGIEEFPTSSVEGVCPALLGSSNCAVGSSKALYNAYWADWEPRVGFAWQPGFLGKTTVLRGAYTISSFLEGTGTNLRLPLNPPFQSEFENDYTTGIQTYYPGSTTDQGLSVLANPTNPYANTNIRLWDPGVQPAIVEQWNLSIEHQLPGDTLVSIGYLGQHGTHLMVPMPYFQRRLVGEAGCTSANAVNLNGSPILTCGSPFLSGDPALYNAIGQISGTASNGDQAYDALQASLTKHLTHGLEVQLSYAYSKAMTNAIGYYGQGGQSASNSAYFQNLYNMRSEWGPTYFDATNNLSGSYTYQLPVGSGRRFGSHMNRIADSLIGGWTVSGIVSERSGFALTVTGPDNSGTKSRGAKANCLGYVPYFHGVGLGTTWFGTFPFSRAATGTFGNCANGTLRGPGLSDWDAGVFKSFKFSESKSLEFRSEFINFTNTPAFGPPNRSVTSSAFGELTGALNTSRNVQFALKFLF
ncbi:MAG: carboxypeptidase regulatory-like domain-containing protein [Terriglobia bacterium]